MAKSMNEQRLQTRKRIRGRVSGTADKPRLTVYKSLQRIYVQAIDDAQGVTLATASTLEKDLRAKVKSGSIRSGKIIAPKLKEIADDLSDHLDTRVSVELGKQKGKIVIEFATIEDLERISKVIKN